MRTATGHILAPEAMVDTGNGVRSSGYGDGRSAFGDIAAISDTTEKRLVRPAFDGVAGDCLLPRGAALDADEHKLVVACFGLNAIVDLRRQEPGAARPRAPSLFGRRRAHRRRRRRVASRDRLVEIRSQAHDRRSARGESAIRSTIFDIDPIGESMSLAAERGRMLFHATGDRRIAFDGRACASCHPDGRDDALTWTTPDGPRQTPMLAGRLEGTAPYGWTGASRDLGEHMKHTFDRLAGKGLSADEQERALRLHRDVEDAHRGSEAEGPGASPRACAIEREPRIRASRAATRSSIRRDGLLELPPRRRAHRPRDARREEPRHRRRRALRHAVAPLRRPLGAVLSRRPLRDARRAARARATARWATPPSSPRTIARISSLYLHPWNSPPRRAASGRLEEQERPR